MGNSLENDKKAVHDFWDEASCGENLYLQDISYEGYEAQARERYELEPYIHEFADFKGAEGKRVLEIGVGLGAEHQHFAEAGAELYGIDLTERAIEHTQRRLAIYGLSSKLSVGDAENLVFPDEQFDIVYSWGVLHHTPGTTKAIAEVWRVLKSGGIAKVMIYHKYSLVGYMLWVRYALFRGRPWLTLSNIYSSYLESPGTKAYSVEEARALFSAFSEVNITTRLSHADLLESEAGQRHCGLLLQLARKLWPRSILKRLFPRQGLCMLIEAEKA
jgi:SAM-dependent methyltransferase